MCDLGINNASGNFTMSVEQHRGPVIKVLPVDEQALN
jgi:hypothetical protein